MITHPRLSPVLVVAALFALVAVCLPSHAAPDRPADRPTVDRQATRGGGCNVRMLSADDWMLDVPVRRRADVLIVQQTAVAFTEAALPPCRRQVARARVRALVHHAGGRIDLTLDRHTVATALQREAAEVWCVAIGPGSWAWVVAHTAEPDVVAVPSVDRADGWDG